MHDTGLLVNLVVALASAAVAAAVALRLRQPVILGYIVAGIVIGPHTPGFVGHQPSVEALADIGLVLLMFAVGVELSLGGLLRVGAVATIGGLIQVAVLVLAGYAVGIALGWPPLEALFLGAVVSISSSIVLSKLLADRGEAGALHGRISLAWASVQDLSTIVLMVILSALAANGSRGPGDVAWAVGKAALFLVLLVPVGSLLLPWLLRSVAALRSRELFVITVGSLALGTAYLSTHFGLALALGAFAAGVVVSESDLWHQILGEVMPLRDMFSALFFVSVGMLIDPIFVLVHWPLVLLMLALIVLAKGLLSTVLVALFRYPARVAVLAGAALAQSGEFSFLLARLGVTSGAVSGQAFNLMLAGSGVSIVLAPAVLAAGRRVSVAAERRLGGLGAGKRAEPEGEVPLQGHVVICGYGRVGAAVGRALGEAGVPYAVIDHDQRLVQALRDQGVPALLGSAQNHVVLDRLGLKQARLLVIALPDALATRQIVGYARRHAPHLEIVARTHSESERRYLAAQGVSEAVFAESELALEIIRYSLGRLDLAPDEVEARVQCLRCPGRVEGKADSA